MKIKTPTLFIMLSIIFSTTVSAEDYKIYFKNQGMINLPDSPAAFAFESHTFTNCGKTGRYGPSQSNCLSSYNADWIEEGVNYEVNDGIQKWIVPEDGVYRITAKGAQSGRSVSRGQGAKMLGDFVLEKGQALHILVGQKGYRRSTKDGNRHDGGGGGSFVATGEDYSQAQPLIVGGGGGGSAHSTSTRMRGNTGECGSKGSSQSGGCNGDAGSGTSSVTGGAGFYGDSSDSDGPKAFVNGGRGASGTSNHYNAGRGGFGGGGGSTGGWYNRGGGGGGYSGGGSSTNNEGDTAYGGGGGSYNEGSNQDNAAGFNSGHGSVIIEKK